MSERLKKASILIDLLIRLKNKDSWSGETHIQKTVYFLQEMAGVPLDFDFILYKHGPFSFDLRDELTAMRADYLIKFEIKPPPYGPSLRPSESGIRIHDNFPKTTGQYDFELEFIATHLGNKGVGALERLGTAYYAIINNLGSDKMDRAKEIHKLKPHLSVEDALNALTNVEKLMQEFEREKASH